MLALKVLKQTPQIDDEEMVLLYPRKNVGQLRVKPARYLKKYYIFFNIATYRNEIGFPRIEIVRIVYDKNLLICRTQKYKATIWCLVSTIAEVALTLVHLNINTMKNKKEENKTIFVHFLWTKAEQS